MEVPVINRFNGLDSGINSLPNPSLLPQILSSRSGFDAISQSLDLWKWSALIITVFATFTGVFTRIQLLFMVFRRRKRILDQTPADSDSDCDDSASSVSSEFEEDVDAGADKPEVSSYRSWDFDFLVKGSDYYLNDFETKREIGLRRRHRDVDGDEFSCADYIGGKSVVKLWDNFRFELEYYQSHDDEIRVFDLIRDQKVGSISAGKSVISPVFTPAVLLTAAGNVPGDTSVNIWDTRVGFQLPALVAEWKPAAGKVPGDRKVYGKITVGDVRNLKSALDTWL